jgi:hypothetical protein
MTMSGIENKKRVSSISKKRKTSEIDSSRIDEDDRNNTLLPSRTQIISPYIQEH